jgi:hypothetical protein
MYPNLVASEFHQYLLQTMLSCLATKGLTLTQ